MALLTSSSGIVRSSLFSITLISSKPFWVGTGSLTSSSTRERTASRRTGSSSSSFRTFSSPPLAAVSLSSDHWRAASAKVVLSSRMSRVTCWARPRISVMVSTLASSGRAKRMWRSLNEAGSVYSDSISSYQSSISSGVTSTRSVMSCRSRMTTAWVKRSGTR